MCILLQNIIIIVINNITILYFNNLIYINEKKYELNILK